MTDVNFKVWGTKMIPYKNAIKLDESGFKGKKNKNKQKISHNLVTLKSKSKMKALLKKHWLQPSEFQKKIMEAVDICQCYICWNRHSKC